MSHDIEVIDGTVLIKSLQADVQSLKTEREHEHEQLGKSLTLVHEMLKEQGNVIKSLGEQVTRMANEGRGRKAVVTVHSADMSKSEPAQMSSDDVLAKCAQAQTAGRISAMDVSMAEAYINRGMPIPDSIRTRL
jgi:hypothetical protein